MQQRSRSAGNQIGVPERDVCSGSTGRRDRPGPAQRRCHTVTSARTADFIELNESHYRPGSGYETYTKTKPDAGGKFIVVDTHIVNDGRTSMDLTCSLPISTVLIDSRNRDFDAIQDLYKLKGNPECNDQLQPGFEADMTYVYLVPVDAAITGWGFPDLTESLGNQDYTAVRFSLGAS